MTEAEKIGLFLIILLKSEVIEISGQGCCTLDFEPIITDGRVSLKPVLKQRQSLQSSNL